MLLVGNVQFPLYLALGVVIPIEVLSWAIQDKRRSNKDIFRIFLYRKYSFENSFSKF